MKKPNMLRINSKSAGNRGPRSGFRGLNPFATALAKQNRDGMSSRWMQIVKSLCTRRLGRRPMLVPADRTWLASPKRRLHLVQRFSLCTQIRLQFVPQMRLSALHAKLVGPAPSAVYRFGAGNLEHTATGANPWRHSSGSDVPATPGRVCKTAQAELLLSSSAPLSPLRVVAPTLRRLDALLQQAILRGPVPRSRAAVEMENAPVSFARQRMHPGIERQGLGNPLPEMCAVRGESVARVHHNRESSATEQSETFDVLARAAVKGNALPSNMAQITDHVITQLDRRMTAWRERLGRV
jgi:hypothetical protein